MQHHNVCQAADKASTDCVITQQMALLDFERARDIMLAELRFWIATYPPVKEVQQEFDVLAALMRAAVS